MADNFDTVREALKKEGFNPVSAGATWDFETNPVMKGVYVDKEEHVGDNNSNMYYFDTDNLGTVGVWGSAIIDARMRTASFGDTIVIIYLGKKKSEKVKGREYKDFEVHKKSATEPVQAKNPGEEIPF